MRIPPASGPDQAPPLRDEAVSITRGRPARPPLAPGPSLTMTGVCRECASDLDLPGAQAPSHGVGAPGATLPALRMGDETFYNAPTSFHSFGVIFKPL